jgi:predicted nucleic acid-binding protein
VYDCLYIALARREGLPLISADKRLLTLARDRLGLQTISLDDINPS